MTAPPNCPDGFGPDLWYRFPMEPFFTEPYGADCGLSYTGLYVFGGILLAFTVVNITLHLVTLRHEENRLFTYIRLSHCLNLVLSSATIITAIVDLSHAYIPQVLTTTVFMSTGSLWIYVGYHTVVKTVVNVQLKKDVTVANLLGGIPFVYLIVFGTILANFGVWAASIALAIFVSQGDGINAVISFRIACAAIAFGTALFLVAAGIALSKFLAIIDASIHSSRHDEKDSPYLTNLKDIATRFRFIRATFMISASAATVIFALHSALIPMFWYLQLVHESTVSVCMLGLLFTLTSPTKRKRLWSICSRCTNRDEASRKVTFTSKNDFVQRSSSMKLATSPLAAAFTET